MTETVEIPAELNDLARVGTVLELEPGHEALDLVRARAGGDLPGPPPSRLRRALELDRRRAACAVCATPGERRPR